MDRGHRGGWLDDTRQKSNIINKRRDEKREAKGRRCEQEIMVELCKMREGNEKCKWRAADTPLLRCLSGTSLPAQWSLIRINYLSVLIFHRSLTETAFSLVKLFS